MCIVLVVGITIAIKVVVDVYIYDSLISFYTYPTQHRRENFTYDDMPIPDDIPTYTYRLSIITPTPNFT